MAHVVRTASPKPAAKRAPAKPRREPTVAEVLKQLRGGDPSTFAQRRDALLRAADAAARLVDDLEEPATSRVRALAEIRQALVILDQWDRAEQTARLSESAPDAFSRLRSV